MGVIRSRGGGEGGSSSPEQLGRLLETFLPDGL